MNSVITITLVVMTSSGLIIGLIARKTRKTEQKKVNNKFDNYDFHLGEMTSGDVPPGFRKCESESIRREKYNGKESN